jgi:hypothetical protein
MSPQYADHAHRHEPDAPGMAANVAGKSLQFTGTAGVAVGQAEVDELSVGHEVTVEAGGQVVVDASLAVIVVADGHVVSELVGQLAEVNVVVTVEIGGQVVSVPVGQEEQVVEPPVGHVEAVIVMEDVTVGAGGQIPVLVGDVVGEVVSDVVGDASRQLQPLLTRATTVVGPQLAR